ncbi:uncharacterized protein LOC119732485 [Patiria miniata]|uniref:Uncharacterized protein n=1 Tax=Patiria miniata TaxID=46514 RepID=A0A914ADQ7_PATMI|nr:uncharacterized protein LOC119732485 [Patiria miniata]
MGAIGTFIVAALAFMCIVRPLCASPEDETVYPNIAEIDVTEMFLFNLVKDVNGQLSSENVQTVFQRIIARQNISPERVDSNSLTALRSKLGRLWHSWRSQKGSNGRSKLLRTFEKNVYTLKVPHKTGSPTKRKLEYQLESEKIKRRKVEESLATVSNDLVKCSQEKLEVERKFERYSDPKKREKGERGRTKGKQSYMYSERQRRRHKHKQITDMKDFLECRKDLLSVEFLDEGGQTVKVVRNDNDYIIRTADQICEEDIDEMIFIMDTFNVTQSGYHEIAQRYSALPRACRIAKRRNELLPCLK